MMTVGLSTLCRGLIFILSAVFSSWGQFLIYAQPSGVCIVPQEWIWGYWLFSIHLPCLPWMPQPWMPVNLPPDPQFPGPGAQLKLLWSKNHKSPLNMILMLFETLHYSSPLLHSFLALVWHDLSISNSSMIWFTVVVFQTDFASEA